MGFDPVLVTASNYNDELAKVKTVGDVLADPLKAMKAEKLEDRRNAVAVLAAKYRRGVLEGESEQLVLPAEQSQLILATILELDWKPVRNPPAGYDHLSTGPGLAGLWGLNIGQNGIPKFVAKPGEDFNVKWKETLVAWAGTDAGRNLELKATVPKRRQGK